MGLENGGIEAIDSKWEIVASTEITTIFRRDEGDLLELCRYADFVKAFRGTAEVQGLRVVETDQGTAVLLNSTNQSIGSAVYEQSLK